MRLVIDQPSVAAERGARAASDIATLHSAQAVGEVIAGRLRDSARPATPSRITTLLQSGPRRIRRRESTD
jgi:hypothetical protein